MVLLGEYGYLSDFSMEPETARSNVDRMYSMGIREFQFYDWFSSYSSPPGGEFVWKNAFNPSFVIRLDTLTAYLTRIRELGCRSWAYVQSVAMDYGDDPCKDQDNCPYVKTNLVDKNIGYNSILSRYSFSVYNPDVNWALRMVSVWAPKVKQLGFTGIHWDSLGKISTADQTIGFVSFLETSKQILQSYGLLQTFNFVSLAWLLSGEITKCFTTIYPYLERFESAVEFLYCEVWNGSEYSKLIDVVKSRARAVVAFYPSVKNDGSRTEDSELQTTNMVNRAQYSRSRNLAYMVVGNGTRRLINEYFMIDVPISNKVSTSFLVN